MHDTEPINQIAREPLIEGNLINIAHVTVHPVSAKCGEIEVHDTNILALPLSGVFAKHDGPDRYVVATANSALFIPAGSPYRLSFPGCIGDQCLTFKFSGAALAQIYPRALTQDRIDTRLFATSALVSPSAMLARQMLWQRFQQGELDALELEEEAVELLGEVLESARRAPERGRGNIASQSHARRARQIERVKEAISLSPLRKWTLADLAELANTSPYHLAHFFRAEVGTSVYQYLIRARLAVALDRVIESDTDLIDLALDLGFASHSHLTSRFRALFGLTPGQMRHKATSKKLRNLRKNLTA